VGAEVRPVMIRPIDELLSSREGPQAGEGIRARELIELPEERLRAQEPEPGRADLGAETEDISIPEPVPSADEVPRPPACDGVAVARPYTATLLRSLSRFASDLRSDLSLGRTEFKTARLQRQSYKALLEFLVLRSLRLFAALVLLYILIDLTHYFI